MKSIYFKDIYIYFKFIVIFITFIYILIIILDKLSILKYQKLLMENERHIFTFWEPNDAIPKYLKLCIDTWKKNILDYKIIILDYKKVRELLGESLFSKVVCKDMTLPIQADGIRVALLKKYGGIWMDIDTIIINEDFIKKLINYEFPLLGYNNPPSQNIGFIFSSKKSKIIKSWLNKIIYNVRIYKELYFKKKYKKKFNKKLWKRVHAWSYLGNGIVDKLVINSTINQFYRLDNDKLNIFPEVKLFKNSSLSRINKYRALYFKKGNIDTIINNSKSLICLHNSWTPKIFKQMSEKQFLKQDILLSHLLKVLLNKK